MRTWSKPDWVKNQEVGASLRGSANIRNYGRGTTWLRLKWQSMYRIENDMQRDNKFYLRDEQTKKEYILDKEEVMQWMKFV
jgi:hypothetical protein